jgi:DNA topoisomerase I
MDEMQNPDEEGLIHVSHVEPGIIRLRRGKGFVYFNGNDEKITDPEVLHRIKSLGIPPMWKNVWICPWPNGYIQAIGTDAKNRKQYLYHPDWTLYQQNYKFQKLREFALALPEIRQVVEQNLRKHNWPREKVLSLILGILDENYLRVGNRRYYEQNESHRLTTLRRKHVMVEGRDMIFQYKGKSNKYHRIKLQNPKLKKLIKGCSELRGYEVFKYIDDHGQIVPVDSRDVNEYLKEITGQDFTSKYFRTWGGTVLALKCFPIALEKKKEKPRIKLEREIVKQVAKELNNTIAVCKKYYIHPAVLEALDENFTLDNYPIDDQPEELSLEERAALAIIEKYEEKKIDSLT